MEKPDESRFKEPLDELVAAMVKKLDAGLREEFEERAAIIEFEAKQSCAHAECLALLDVLNRHPTVLTGLTVLQVELDGATQWMLAIDVDSARKRIAELGGVGIQVVRDLAAVVQARFGGLAKLRELTNASRLRASRFFEHL